MKATVIGFDIKQYSGSENMTEMDNKRDILRNTLQSCLHSYPEIEAGFNNTGTPDTGDGCYIIVDSGKFENIINFLEDVKTYLSNQTSIRLRAAVHRDCVKETKSINGKSKTWIGNGVNNCARNLDSEPLKTLIDINGNKNFVYGLSKDFVNDISTEINLSNYESFCFKTKDYVSKIYLNYSDDMKLPEKKDLPELIEFTFKDIHKELLEKCDFHYPDTTKPNNLLTFFVYPYLLYQKISNKNKSKIDAKDLIDDFITNRRKLLIIGDDQTGKTSLAKKYVIDLFDSRKILPVYISCKPGVPKKYNNLVQENFNRQYNQKYNKDLEKYVVLVLDNFNLWNDTQQKDFIENVSPDSNVIIFANSLINESMEKINLLKAFSLYEIKTFGHEKRAELINKWIDFVDNDNKNHNYQLFDDMIQFVNQTLLSGLIPYTPFYILTSLLAKKEYSENPNDKISSKAKCYEMLVFLQLKSINIHDQEISNYIGIFSYIAYQLHEKNKNYFSTEELTQVILDYKNEYTLDGTPEEIIETLNKSSIFCLDSSFGQYAFHNHYSYYYFLGKFIAENFSESDDIKTLALSLLDKLYEKQNYYISIFIVHHLKDKSYFSEICNRADKLYKDYPIAKLTDEEFVLLEEEYTNSERLIIDSIDNSKANRLAEARARDKYEESKGEDDVSPDEALKEIQQTIRIVELLGQVVKNHGLLKRTDLTRYYTVGMNTYKRVCSYFLTNFKKYKNEFIEILKQNIEKKGTVSTSEVKRMAYAMFGNMNFLSVYATIYRISDALSANHLIDELVKPIFENEQNPMNFCIYIHGLMWYKKELPFDDLKGKFPDMPEMVQYLIQAFLKEYTDKHHISTKQRDLLAKTFKMNKNQLEYDRTK